jgi:hypothetical protein
MQALAQDNESYLAEIYERYWQPCTSRPCAAGSAQPRRVLDLFVTLNNRRTVCIQQLDAYSEAAL